MTGVETLHSSVYRRATAVVMAAAMLPVLAGCSESHQQLSPLDQAIAVNESRHVATAFEEHPVVIGDDRGIESLDYFFRTSETLVVTDETVEAQLRGASIAVAAHAPMLVYSSDHRQEILKEIERLKTHTVLTVGAVSLAQTSGRVAVYRDPGGMDALGRMTAERFTEHVVASPGDAADAVANLDPNHPRWLRAAWADPVVMSGASAKPFPITSRRDAHMAPVVIATEESPVASVANARSFGAAVTMVEEPDPRESNKTLFAMAGLAELPLVALGSQFGSGEELSRRIMQAEEYYYSKPRSS